MTLKTSSLVLLSVVSALLALEEMTVGVSHVFLLHMSTGTLQLCPTF